VARRELDAERGKDAIERAVLERQLLGVALEPLDLYAELDCAPARRREQLRCQVEGGGVRAGHRSAKRNVSRAGRDVEPVRFDSDPVEQMRRRHGVRDRLRNCGVVARGPGGAMDALQVVQLDRRHDGPPARERFSNSTESARRPAAAHREDS
jgi:hypothetical protein